MPMTDKAPDIEDESKNNDGDEHIDDDEKTYSKRPIKDKLTAINGQEVKSEIVFIAAFKHLHELTKRLLRMKKIKGIKSEEIQWIDTVPAIWNDAAKYQMRQWTIDAGLVDPQIPNQCKIVYEPDCASLSIQYEIQQRKKILSNSHPSDDPEIDEHKITKDNTDSDHDDEALGVHVSTAEFVKGEKYILVDAGG